MEINEIYDLSIIIVNWNTKKLLSQCLRSVYETTQIDKYEVYVVDNGSTDGSPEMIKKEFKKVKLIENKLNEGFSRANNKAIRKSKGRYILLLNSDTVVMDRALNSMVKFMDEHKEVGVLGCKLNNKDGSLQLSAAWFPNMVTAILGGNIIPMMLGRFLHIKRFPGQTYLSPIDHGRLQEVDWIVGACMLVRHEAINEAGLMDENLFMYGEETEWCFRIKNAGWTVVYFPYAQIIHFGSSSTVKKSELPLYRRVFAERYIYHRLKNQTSSRIYDLLIISMALVKLPIWGILLLVLPFKHNAIKHLDYYKIVIKSILGIKSYR